MSDEIAALVSVLSGHLIAPERAQTEVPPHPGLYSWWASPSALPLPAGQRHQNEPVELIYVGLAADLRRRLLRQHLAPRTGSSTLRRTLAALLQPDLSWTAVWANDRVTLNPAAEAALTDWMHRHLRLSYVEHPDPRTVESAVIPVMRPPLNLSENSEHPLYPHVTSARRRWRQSAGQQPPRAD